MRGEREGETDFLRADQPRVPRLSEREAPTKMALLYLTTAMQLLRGPARPGRASRQPDTGKQCLVPACTTQGTRELPWPLLHDTKDGVCVCFCGEALIWNFFQIPPGEPAFQPATTNLQSLPRIWLAGGLVAGSGSSNQSSGLGFFILEYYAY